MLEFIMTVGIPCSGKTTFANNTGYKIFTNSNGIREDLLKGINCIYDAMNLKRNQRISLINSIKDLDCKKTCVLFCPPVELCKARNLLSGKKVSEKEIDDAVKCFETPGLYEGWNSIVFNKNKQTAAYPDTTGFDQHSKHHTLTLDEHMKKAADYCEANNFGSALEIAAQFHDIGKCFTQTFDGDKVHYYNHHNYSAYLFLSGFTSILPQDLYIAQLINWHMKPFLSWEKSEKSRKKDRQLIGEQMYQDIMKLHEADSYAH